MTTRRAIAGCLAGALGIGLAVAAMITGHLLPLVAAGLCTIAALALLFTGVSRDPGNRERNNLREETHRLTTENDRMAARAARFEAEAIAAKAELTRALRPDGPPAAPREPAQEQVIVDALTGVFTETFFDATLGKRISAARRGLRPLSLALVEVTVGLGSTDQHPADPKLVAEQLLHTLREADTVARLEDGTFALLLEDTPENGAIWTLERIRRRLAETIENATMWAGMSCYPAYAFDSAQILEQAGNALAAAREWQQDRIEVTTAGPED